MRVVYLNPSGQLGGAEMSLLDILASMRKAQPEWSLRLVVSAAGPLVSRATTLGVQTTILPFPPALARLGDAGMDGPAGQQLSRPDFLKKLLSAGTPIATYIKQLRRTLKEFAPDVLHTNGFKMHVLGIWARPRRVPVIWHVRDYVRSRPVMARLLRWHAAYCAAIITNSKSVAEDVRAACGNGVKVYPVYNAIDLESFSPNGPALDLDALAGLPPAQPGTVRIGLLATMARWKGQEVFLRALSLLPESLRIRGYIVGGPLYQTDGSQYDIEELRRLADQLGISHKVGFTGYVEEPAAAMRSLDIVVHASTQPEPFGRAIVEAMACRRAVIASQTVGAAEIITNGIDALIYTPGDAVMLAEHIKLLATDTRLRVALGQAGRVTAEHCFDHKRLATELLPIYHAITFSNN